MQVNDYITHLRLPRALLYQGRETAYARGETLSLAIRRFIEAYVASEAQKQAENTNDK